MIFVHAEYFCDVMFMLAFHGETRSVVVVVAYVYCSVMVKRILSVNASTSDDMI